MNSETIPKVWLLNRKRLNLAPHHGYTGCVIVIEADGDQMILTAIMFQM